MSDEIVFRMPIAPLTLSATGLAEDVVFQLALKTMHFGEFKGAELATRLGVRFGVLEPCLRRIVHERLASIVAGQVVGSPSYVYRLTEAGRQRAAMYLAHNHYVGPVPVPLPQYRQHMAHLRQDTVGPVTRRTVRNAFADLVLNDRELNALGPAIAARQSLFIYGPPGNGKTAVSQDVRNLFLGDIAVPHALAIDGHIIRFFDQVHHQPVDTEVSASLERHDHFDHRWVRCRRPLVIAGGELTLAELDLRFNPSAGFYRPPLQALANGGVLVIDDFGRQRVTPVELLNRWIGPLENHVDYLTLQTGQKFAFPFDVMVVFATNLAPSELLDEAFLRRIQYKVFLESPTADEFVRIFHAYCQERGLACEDWLPEELLARELGPRGVSLRGCQPRDLIEQALSLASYLEQPRKLTIDLLSTACENYFVRQVQAAAA